MRRSIPYPVKRISAVIRVHLHPSVAKKLRRFERTDHALRVTALWRMADYIRWAGGCTETTADAGVFLHVGDRNPGRCHGPEDSDLFLPDLHLDGARRTGLFARAAAATALLIDLGQDAILFVIEDHLAQGAKEFSTFPSLVSGVSDEPSVVFLSSPFSR